MRQHFVRAVYLHGDLQGKNRQAIFQRQHLDGIFFRSNDRLGAGGARFRNSVFEFRQCTGPDGREAEPRRENAAEITDHRLEGGRIADSGKRRDAPPVQPVRIVLHFAGNGAQSDRGEIGGKDGAVGRETRTVCLSSR